MKVLLDENLSPKLVGMLADVYPSITHVREIGLERADDETIWEYAKSHGYLIVSKDDDFHQRSFLYGSPPKVVWLRLGNCSTRQVEQHLRNNAQALEGLVNDPQASFLALS